MIDTDDLRAWRARRRITQAQAAELLDYTRRGYQDIESRKGPVPARLWKAFEALERQTETSQ